MSEQFSRPLFFAFELNGQKRQIGDINQVKALGGGLTPLLVLVEQGNLKGVCLFSLLFRNFAYTIAYV